ncbi:translation elongation factor Ts [Selenomonas sp.]|uniref:translation elongation factor Ts n=1 Tax=Selenomonas sp. TaxID=2053611 RepID=UPI002A80947C|nr:translation elongation factor Ts [Selenomonas sp.]MDY4416446.1 translation elongation factor Ts [Selenomonas sp.]
MAIKASQVKELREKTGAGMMDCKKALTATDGDMQAAIDWLREKGISKAAKKASRIAAEGAVASYVTDDGKVGVLVEVNCETDFAAGNEQFRALEAKIAKHIADTNPADLAALNASEIDGKTVEALVTEATATIGEKISLRRFTRFETVGKLASYIHMGGKIGVLVNLTGGSDELGKDVAMQVAAANPIAIDESGVPAEVVAHEREVALKQAEEENEKSAKKKPANILERIVDGRIKKYYKEVCLEQQLFVKDPNKTVTDILGGEKVTEFVRYQLGEGIEKKQEDFAAEVKAQMQ